MGLILGIVVAVVTAGIVLLAWFANAMSDASGNRASVLTPFLIGGGISAVLIFSHYFHFAW